DLLPLEVEVRRHGGQRRKEAAVSRGRESTAETDGRRPGARHSGAEGGRRKKMVKPTAYRQAVGFLRGEFEFSERRACSVLGFQRSSCRYVARRTMVQGLLDDIRVHAAARPRFGYRRIHVLLRRSGWRVNHKRVYRIYRAEGLAVRRRKRKR